MKLSEQGLNAVKILKNNQEFIVFLGELEKELQYLDKLSRNQIEPNRLLRVSGQAKEIEDVLHSIESV